MPTTRWPSSLATSTFAKHTDAALRPARAPVACKCEPLVNPSIGFLILLYKCLDTTTYVGVCTCESLIYCCICFRMPLYICLHTSIYVSCSGLLELQRPKVPVACKCEALVYPYLSGSQTTICAGSGGLGMQRAGYAILLCMCHHTARDPAGWLQGRGMQKYIC